MAPDTIMVKEGELKKMAAGQLVKAGMPQDQAAVIADVLVFADLRGVYSHGVMRVEHYVNRILAGGMNLHPRLKLKKIKPSIALVDAQGASGAVSTKYAMEEVLRMAGKQGMAMAGIKNNSHCGALAYYVQMALDASMASLVMGNTDSCVVPWGGKSPYLGTNPFAFGYPGAKESLLLDMATSEVALGRIFHAREKKIPIPPHWAADSEGKSCTDPEKASFLFPFGRAKGYGINVMVEALTGLLVGGVFGPHVKKMYSDLGSRRNISNFLLVIDPSVFGSSRDFLQHSQQMIDELHAVPPAPGYDKVMIPGEIERKQKEKSLKEGIPVPLSIYNYLSGE